MLAPAFAPRSFAGARLLALAVAVPLAGCAAGLPHPQAAYKSVVFVGKAPAPSGYRCVGKVTGTAFPDAGFVEAAHLARVDIKTKAARLGAKVVKIDVVRVPGEWSDSAKPVVMLTGRAYRPVDKPATTSRRAGHAPRGGPAGKAAARRPSRHVVSASAALLPVVDRS